MYIYRKTDNSIVAKNQQTNIPDETYVGTDAGWSNDQRRFPFWDGLNVIVDAAALSQYNSYKLAQSLTAKIFNVSTEMERRASIATVTHAVGMVSGGEAAQRNIHGLHTLVVNGRGPATPKITTTDGLRVAVTDLQLLEIGELIANNLDTLYDSAAAHVAAIKNLSTIEAVDGYDVTAGW